MKEKTKKVVIGISAALLILGAAGATVAIVNHQNHFIDNIAANAGNVTMKNLIPAYDFDNMTDDDKLVVKKNADGYMETIKYGQVTLLTGFSAQIGEMYHPVLDCKDDDYMIECSDVTDLEDMDSESYVTITKSVSNERVYLKANVLGSVIKSVGFYRVSDLGYKSETKTKYVFDKLTQDMKTIKGDLTFKKADVNKYAKEYEDSLKATSSAATSTAAASSAA